MSALIRNAVPRIIVAINKIFSGPRFVILKLPPPPDEVNPSSFPCTRISNVRRIEIMTCVVSSIFSMVSS